MATTNVHISLHLSKIQNQHPVLTTALDGYAGRRDSQRSRPRGETLSAKTRPFADKTLIHLHLSVKTPLCTDKLWGGTGLSGPKRFLADKRVMNGDLSAGMRLFVDKLPFQRGRIGRRSRPAAVRWFRQAQPQHWATASWVAGRNAYFIGKYWLICEESNILSRTFRHFVITI